MGGLSSICAQKWIRQTRDVGTIAFMPYLFSGLNLISNLVTDYIQKRRGEPGLNFENWMNRLPQKFPKIKVLEFNYFHPPEHLTNK